ncbi:helix-turn-helix domain-containing protein [Streptomyces tsukubensis]|uniref:helix-turn-helix domain-containing protein n=1 Tax=Streptomyces tsukubensis TaxID=83656 RepID=UPI00344FB971
MPRVPPTPRIVARRRRIAARIRAARIQARLTQERLALDVGMDRSGYQRIEHGTNSPQLDTLLAIADALNIPLAELVRDDEGPGPGP